VRVRKGLVIGEEHMASLGLNMFYFFTWVVFTGVCFINIVYVKHFSVSNFMYTKVKRKRNKRG
jgi:hypothetical protein